MKNHSHNTKPISDLIGAGLKAKATANETNPAKAKAAATDRKTWAPYNLVITFTKAYANANGMQSKTLRSDLVRLNFEGDHIRTKGIHDVALLCRKMLDYKNVIERAVIYDNDPAKYGKKTSIVYEVQRDFNNELQEGRDVRDEIYDTQTGRSY